MTPDRVEHVLVVPSADVNELLGDASMLPDDAGALSRLLSPERLSFIPRAQAEADERFRQIIPYVVVSCAGRLLTYRRAQSGGEGRLHGKTSFGWGGHVSLADIALSAEQFDVPQTIDACAARELREELALRRPSVRRSLGMIAERDTAVGLVHFGVVMLWSFSMLPTMRADSTSDSLGWFTPDEISTFVGLETWSSRALELLISANESAANNGSISAETVPPVAAGNG